MEFHPIVESKEETPAQLECPDSVKYAGWRSGLKERIEKQKAVNAALRKQYEGKLNAPLILSDAQLDGFVSTGILIVPREDMWTSDEVTLLIEATKAMDEWPESPGKWMKYFEKEAKDSKGGKAIARIENFAQYNPGLNYFVNGQKLLGLSGQLLGEEAILYKEKINYKLPGGAGFNPHQDVAAGWWLYKQSVHISTLVAIDEATISNGCLEVVYGKHHSMLSAPWKELESDVYDKLDFKYVETRPGDVVFFDSYVPHRSAPNHTKSPRRVLYATYAKKAEGDFRARYYRDKRQSYPPDCERIPGKVYEYKV